MCNKTEVEAPNGQKYFIEQAFVSAYMSETFSNHHQTAREEDTVIRWLSGLGMCGLFTLILTNRTDPLIMFMFIAAIFFTVCFCIKICVAKRSTNFLGNFANYLFYNNKIIDNDKTIKHLDIAALIFFGQAVFTLILMVLIIIITQ